MPNEVRMHGATAFMSLSKGQTAMLDAADLPLVLPYLWYATENHQGGYYASARQHGKTLYMHRIIMGVTDSRAQVDHLNHTGIDNRRDNLRVVTNRQNNQNREGAYRNSGTGLRGIIIEHVKGNTYYRATVMVNYKTVAKKRFLYCRDGLREAIDWLIERRRELMPFDTGVIGDVDAALAAAPDAPPERRYEYGEIHHAARLTAEQVREMRRLAATGVTHADLRRQFGMSSASVRRIVNRIDWKYLDN